MTLSIDWRMILRATVACRRIYSLRLLEARRSRSICQAVKLRRPPCRVSDINAYVFSPMQVTCALELTQFTLQEHAFERQTPQSKLTLPLPPPRADLASMFGVPGIRLAKLDTCCHFQNLIASRAQKRPKRELFIRFD
jgi:hypothetical protein